MRFRGTASEPDIAFLPWTVPIEESPVEECPVEECPDDEVVSLARGIVAARGGRVA